MTDIPINNKMQDENNRRAKLIEQMSHRHYDEQPAYYSYRWEMLLLVIIVLFAVFYFKDLDTSCLFGQQELSPRVKWDIPVIELDRYNDLIGSDYVKRFL